MTPEHFSQLDNAARRIWAKSGEGYGHSLLAHMLDVAAVVETLLELEPPSTLSWAAAQFGLPQQHIARWLGALAGLHDFGKAIPGFQAKWPEGRAHDEQHALGFGDASLSCTKHDLATAALLRPLLAQLAACDTCWAQQAIQAISAHHGYHFRQSEIGKGKPLAEDKAWRDCRQQLLSCFWQALAPQGEPQRDELTNPAVNWLAGMTSVADWIASNPEWFPLGERQDRFVDYFSHAKVLAGAALHNIGWRAFGPLLGGPEDTALLLARLLGAAGRVEPRPLQMVGADLLAIADGPSLLLVEAPMGEGKTELAFLAHLYLQAHNQHRGLYVALPTQATGNALFARAETFLRHFAGEQQLDLQLIHGGAAQSEALAKLRDVDFSVGESLSSSSWFSQRRRPLLSPYGVGTIDQALFAVLNVKHHFVRLWGLANRVVVLDEVHAYDAYTEGLIEALLRWLKAMGSSVVLMSATLPRKRRDSLVRAWGIASEELPDLAYPRLLLADNSGVKGASFASRPLAPIDVNGIAESVDAMAAAAFSAVSAGGCGAVIVNTVDRAQQLYRQLKNQLPADVQLMLFHARIPADERSQREAAVLATFGKTGVRPPQALLIATQVVEQSLDIDFDFLISDLAPVDLLLQRAGRLHRHERDARPEAHAVPRLTVAGLLPGQLPDLTTTAWRFVYEPYLLGMTWALLLEERSLQLPADIDRLVQLVYGDGELPAQLDEQIRQYIEERSLAEHLAGLKDKRQRAFNIAVQADAEPQHAYNDKPRGHEEGEGEEMGLVNCTRLGEPSVTLIPLHRVAGGYALHADGEAISLEQPLPGALAQQLYQRQLKVANKAVVHYLLQQPLPVAFEDSALLRHCRPLLLDGGRLAVNGRLTLELDDELGLVYQRPTASQKEEM